MDTIQDKIGNSSILVGLGDMTKVPADAYIVPQFTSGSSFGGVGGAVARAGGTKGMELYQEFVDSQGEQKFGTVLLTESGGGQSKHILHVTSVDSPKEHEFDTIQTAFYNALKVAEENGIKKIAAPAMGTGIIGQLTSEQSAKAMMSAIQQYEQEGGKPLDISFVIFGDREAFRAFRDTLKTKSYTKAQKEEGKAEFSAARWAVGFTRDAEANTEAFGDKHPKRDRFEPDGSSQNK